jgi:hypothetical protein
MSDPDSHEIKEVPSAQAEFDTIVAHVELTLIAIIRGWRSPFWWNVHTISSSGFGSSFGLRFFSRVRPLIAGTRQEWRMDVS